MKSAVLFLAGVLALSFGPISAAPAQAAADTAQPQEITADKVEVSTPELRPNLDAFEPPLGTYTYLVSWQGIPAAEAKLTVDRDGEYYRVDSSARTNSFIDMFYRLRYWAKALVGVKDLRPKFSVSFSRENSRQKDSEILFLPNGVVNAVRRETGKEPLKLRFDPKNQMLDPFSAAFLARGLDWRIGETKEFDTFNGRTRYLVSLTAVDRVNITVNGKPRAAWVITPKVKKLTAPDDSNKKLRTAKIYLTDDKRREVLKIESEVFVGTVTTRLVSFAEAQKTPALADAARAQGPRRSAAAG